MKRLQWIAALLLLGSTGLFAAGTAAGTQIDNSVSLSYSVGGVNQNNVASNTDSFVVDNKIDFVVAHQDTAAVSVVPGQTSAVLTFTVENDGNKVQDFSLSSLPNDENPFGETDNFDASNVQIFVDSNGNGVYDAGTDTATYIDELAPDTNVTVFIVADIPNSQVDGDVAEYTLIAQVAQGGTSGTQGADITSDNSGSTDNAMTEEIVFADAAGANGSSDGGAKNGKHSDNDAYKVVTAKLSAHKTSCVVNDPVNGTNNPHRIPGATIRYAIQVDNNGSADADNVSTTDTLSNNLSFSMAYIHEGSCNCGSPSGTDNEGDASTSQSGQNVTLNFGTVEANSKECAYIEATIN